LYYNLHKLLTKLTNRLTFKRPRTKHVQIPVKVIILF